MSRYNKFFESKFHGCAVLGSRRDEGRGRYIAVFGMPETYDVVGLFDGYDTWIAPPTKAEQSILEELRAGLPRELESGQTRRRFDDGTYGDRPADGRRQRKVAEVPAAVANPLRRERRAVPG